MPHCKILIWYFNMCPYFRAGMSGRRSDRRHTGRTLLVDIKTFELAAGETPAAFFNARSQQRALRLLRRRAALLFVLPTLAGCAAMQRGPAVALKDRSL